MSNIDANSYYFAKLKRFPIPDNGTINTSEFLDAAIDLTKIFDKISKVFAPVKYDMLGNVEKIKKLYDIDTVKNSNLLELIANEQKSKGNTATEGLLWLNRAILFFELVFDQILEQLKKDTYEESMSKLFAFAYEGSVKKYHGWMGQQLFSLICKMSPTLSQIIKSLDGDIDRALFMRDLKDANIKLHLNRAAIDQFYDLHKLNVSSKVLSK